MGARTAWLVVALALASCGGDGDSAGEAADGRLARAPDPLTIEDVEKVPQGSAQAAVMRILFWAQWGNLPAIVDAYAGPVVDRLDISNFTGAYAWLRPQLAATRFKILEVRRAGTDVFVGLELATANDRRTRESFVMRRTAGRWRVVYDTLLDRALKGYVVERSNPAARRQSSQALRAGERAAQAYRDAHPSVSARLRR